jgi:hypothetical protein
MVVFALARNGSRFYQQESRIAEASLGNVVAFDRLSHDIARAGFLSTPNIRRDPSYCGDATTLPLALQTLASVRIDAADTDVATNPVITTAGLAPQSITLSGSYDTVDRYEAWHVDLSGAGYAVRLQTGIGALLRLGYATLDATAQATLLARLFPTGRALRLLNLDTGTFQVSTITGTGIVSSDSFVYLSPSPVLNIAGQRCGLRGTTLVNVINIVRYRLVNVKDSSGFSSYAPLFQTGSQPFESNRLELIREELSTSGTPIASTQEVVAEYAVDLRFALTTIANTTTSTFTAVGFNNPTLVQAVAGPTNLATSSPQSIRAVRARLSVRSREVDRQEDVSASTNVAPGLYRIKLTDSTTKHTGFARVRTLQSDIAIPSHLELRW